MPISQWSNMWTVFLDSVSFICAILVNYDVFWHVMHWRVWYKQWLRPDSTTEMLFCVVCLTCYVVGSRKYKIMLLALLVRLHISPVLCSLHWLPVKQLINFKILVIVYQAIHGLAPDYIQELINVYQPKRVLRSANELLLVVPRTNTVTYGSKSFRTLAATKWNSLPTQIRDSPSLNCFKRSLKTYLFSIAYGHQD